MNTQEQRLRLLAQRRYQRQLRRRRSLSLVLLAAVTVIAVGFLLAKRPARAGAEEPAAAVQPEEAAVQPEEAAMPETAFDLSLVNADHVWNGAESDTLVSVYDYKLDSYNVRDTELLLEERVIAPVSYTHLDV